MTAAIPENATTISCVTIARGEDVQDLRPQFHADAGGQKAGDTARSTVIQRGLCTLSARLSHGVFIGLIGIAIQIAVRSPQPVSVTDVAVAAPSPARVLGNTVQADPIMPAGEGAKTRVAKAAVVLPVRPERPRDVVLTAMPDQPQNTNLKLPKMRSRVIVATVGRPTLHLKPVRGTPPELSSAGPEEALDASHDISTLMPSKITLAAVKAKTASERRATKPVANDTTDHSAKIASASVEKEKTLAALAPPNKTIDVPAIGVAIRREATTVIDNWADDQIAEGRKTCQALLKGVDMVMSDVAPIKEGACGAPAPIVVRSLAAPKIDIAPPATLTCPMAAALNEWLTKSVQPAALEAFGVPVVRLVSASSYACRNRYGQSTAPLSEHALVNALDLSGFVLADGRTVKVEAGWGPVARDAVAGGATGKTTDKVADASSKIALKPAPMRLGGTVTAAADSPKPATEKSSQTKTSEFLRRVHREACSTFGTVLGPEANDAHRNHFHLDMMARRRSAYCQ
jgi:hypothetical protein